MADNQKKSDNPHEANPELLRRYREGDAGALDELVSVNLGLVKSLALRFRDRGIEYEDLIQIGTIGMIKAIKSFDPAYKTAFSTYAVPLIIGEIRRCLRDDGSIKVSRTLKRLGSDALHKKEAFIRQHGREPTINELAELCGITPEELAYSLEAVSPVYSLSEALTSDDGDDSLTLDDLLSDREDAIEALTERLSLKQAIMELPEMQRRIIIFRYFRELSQQQTAELLGLTQVKVSREEKKIMETLRSRLKM